jgi:hypothetical protein
VEAGAVMAFLALVALLERAEVQVVAVAVMPLLL